MSSTPNAGSPVFRLTAEQLSSIFSPQKDATKLAALGGLEAVLSALNVDPLVGIAHTGMGFNPATIEDAADVLLDPEGPETTNSIREFVRSSSSILVPPPVLPASASKPQAAANVDTADIDLEAAPFTHAKADNDARIRTFGSNRLPKSPTKTFFGYILDSFKDKMLQMLCVAAAITLVVETTHHFTPSSDASDKSEQSSGVEGIGILIAVVIVVAVSSFSEWEKARQFRRLKASSEDTRVNVIRESKQIVISVFSLLVGDILVVHPGDIVPVDGIFVSGYSVKCDESSATGESDAVKKGLGPGLDPLFLSGSTVVEGSAKVLVTSVGVNSFNGKIMMSLRTPAERTPLQSQLDDLAEAIAKIGLGVAIVMLAALLIHYVVIILAYEGIAKTYGFRTGALDVVASLLEIATKTVAIIVVAVPEGLPLAVTLALCYATNQMKREKCLVRVNASCEVLANTTTVCSDKTGTLTQNKMTVVRACFGGTTIGFNLHDGKSNTTASASCDESDQEKNASTVSIPNLSEATPLTNGNENEKPNTLNSKKNAAESSDAPQVPDFSTSSMMALRSLLKDQIYFELLNDAIAINSTAFSNLDERTNTKVFVGSKTECALLDMQRRAGIDCEMVRRRRMVTNMFPFDSKKKLMATVILTPRTNADSANPQPISNDLPHRIFVKGASEVVLSKCTHIYNLDATASQLPPTGEPQIIPIDDKTRSGIEQMIDNYASASLRTIVLGYRDVPTLPPNAEDNEEGILQDFIFLALVGIEDPLRPGVSEAVQVCQSAGIFVRMVTGDNAITARAIATQAGILQKGGLVLEGSAFRKLSPEELKRILPRVQVLARSSPMDKHLLVATLRSMGEVVAVTGDGTNDAPALKLADVGISMGISGTQVAQEASDIVLLNDNFTSIVRAILWGRNVNDAIRKFLQFQLSVNISAVFVNFVVNFIPGVRVLTVVQLLYVNLIMDSLAALAFATESPHPRLLKRHPGSRDAPLITFQMWKMILSQAFLQVTVCLVSVFALKKFKWIFTQATIESPNLPEEDIQLLEERFETHQVSTVVFTTFIFFQLFNEVNCRIIDSRLNIFDGIHKSYIFLGILAAILATQVLIVETGLDIFDATPLNLKQWGLSVVAAFLVFPLGAVMRLLPESAYFWHKPAPPKRQFVTQPRLQWAQAIERVQTQLRVYKALRGDRVITDIAITQNTRSVTAGSGIGRSQDPSSYAAVKANNTVEPAS